MDNLMSNLKISNVLKNLMSKDRHTITSISKATGIPKSTISEWLNNRSPNPVHAAKVAKHLGISLHYLLFSEEDSEEPLHRFVKEDLFNGTFEINIKRVKIGKAEK
ncbi:MAG: helix-turn-helix transcriptional regulator [Bdellovibrionota bacterium]